MNPQVTILIALSILHLATSQQLVQPCLPTITGITETDGKITENALWKGTHCNHTWEFDGLPNENTMLVLNMTYAPIGDDFIKLYSEDFVDGSKDPYCKILDFTYRSFRDQTEQEKAAEIHREFPACKLRSGVTPPARITFIGRPHFFVPPEFTIEYKAVPIVPTTDSDRSTTTKSMTPSTISTTSSTTSSSESTTSSELATSSENEPLDRTSLMTIILAVLGGIVLLLIAFLAAALLRRQRRLSHSVQKEQCEMSNFYQSIHDNPSPKHQNGQQIYDEISNAAKAPLKKIKKSSKKSKQRDAVGRTESVKDVVNPLYEPQLPHSYEYIDVKFPSSGQQQRSAV